MKSSWAWGLLALIGGYQLIHRLGRRSGATDEEEDAAPRSLARRWSIGLGIIAVIWIALGALLYQTPTTPRVTVAAIQPYQPTVPNLARGMRDAARKGAQIVVWPEGALNYDPRQRNSDIFQRLAKENNVYLVIGFAQRFDLGLYFWDHGINIEINDPT